MRRGVLWTGDGLLEPVEVGGRALGDFEGDHLGDLIGMFGLKGLGEVRIGGAGGFDEGERFGVGLKGGVPAVDGFDLRDDIDAGGELLLDQKCANLTRCFGTGKGGKDEEGL
jgi:hypothetical protein